MLVDLGLHVVLVTGDNESTARAVASELGIDEVIADALPADKVRAITRLQDAGRSVAMVGDGVNDGPAIARARLGVAVGSGTDVAIHAADVIVVRDDLRVVATAIELSRRTIATIRGNLRWAFGYNVAAIPLAACGVLDPFIAAGAMALSSGFVVWNSARLRHVGPTAAAGAPTRTAEVRHGGPTPSRTVARVGSVPGP
jgi:cation-transporting P-type ATPase A/B/Cu+-exporting ATPase